MKVLVKASEMLGWRDDCCRLYREDIKLFLLNMNNKNWNMTWNISVPVLKITQPPSLRTGV